MNYIEYNVLKGFSFAIGKSMYMVQKYLWIKCTNIFINFYGLIISAIGEFMHCIMHYPPLSATKMVKGKHDPKSNGLASKPFILQLN